MEKKELTEFQILHTKPYLQAEGKLIEELKNLNVLRINGVEYQTNPTSHKMDYKKMLDTMISAVQNLKLQNSTNREDVDNGKIAMQKGANLLALGRTREKWGEKHTEEFNELISAIDKLRASRNEYAKECGAVLFNGIMKIFHHLEFAIRGIPARISDFIHGSIKVIEKQPGKVALTDEVISTRVKELYKKTIGAPEWTTKLQQAKKAAEETRSKYQPADQKEEHTPKKGK